MALMMLEAERKLLTKSARYRWREAPPSGRPCIETSSGSLDNRLAKIEKMKCKKIRSKLCLIQLRCSSYRESMRDLFKISRMRLDKLGSMFKMIEKR
jgi:hypothetical protein